MKCAACGYRYGEQTTIEDEVKIINDGSEDFISIQGNYKTFQGEVNLYMCPKCGTVKAIKW